VVSTGLLRAINLSIAVLLAAILVLGYWYVWRPLPQTSGQITAPISGKASISRDALGVPHISAASSEDAIFLEGYVMAQDRLWQMDAIRRLAAGQLAEITGKGSLPLDEEAHRLRLPRIASAQERNMTSSDRALFAAFSRGVNYFMETHRGRLPLEFALLRYDPRPWSPRDSVLVGLEMYRTLTSSWRSEILKQHLLERGERSKVEALFPLRTGFDVQPGSNAWALSGTHSTTGKPILANDPHLEFSIPSPWYLVHLKAPGLDVTGATLSGLPAVIIGHNERIAWGVTNLEFDVQDLYRERMDMQTGRYQVGDHIEQAQPERDMIAVKGSPGVEVDSWLTHHGPAFVADEGQTYSLRWTAAEPASFGYPFLEVDRARNWNEFTAALSRFPGPGQNFVYADRDGNIGYHAAGKLPVREHCDGDVPSEGPASECEWTGYIPFDQLPQAFNPPSGMIVSANQNPFPPGTSQNVNGNFAAPYRAYQIQERLASRDKWKPEEILNVQKDVYSAFFDFLAKQIVKAFDASKPPQPQLKEAVDALRGWNGQMEIGQAAPMIASLTFEQLRLAVGNRAAPGLGAAYQSAFQVSLAQVVIEDLLRRQPSEWFSDYNQLLIKSLTDGIAEGVKFQGSRVSRWDYGRYNVLGISHPIGGQLPLIGRYFNIPLSPMSGSPTSVKQMTRHLGPSLRMIVDLGDLDHSFANLVTGESGQWLSRHYKDQWNAYYVGRSFPMQFGNVTAENTLLVNPQ